MEVIEIFFDTIRGTATLIDSSALHGLWKIVVGDMWLIIDHSYIKAQTYTLKEYSPNVDVKKALEQVPVIMWQIAQFIQTSKPKPPKRYR